MNLEWMKKIAKVVALMMSTTEDYIEASGDEAIPQEYVDDMYYQMIECYCKMIEPASWEALSNDAFKKLDDIIAMDDVILQTQNIIKNHGKNK